MGISSGSGVRAKNLLVDCITTDFGTLHADSNYNASTDATAPGANSRISQTFTYENAVGLDYHLDSIDAGAKDFGTDLSGDATYPITLDVDGTTRSGSWDIGADELVTSGIPAGVLAAILEDEGD